MEDMFITPIQPWSRVGDAAASGQTSASSQSLKGQDGVSAFKSIFEEAINNVRETDQNLAKNQYLLATGQIEDLLAALRTKALEAYNEIMRLSS